mmetsp:Transcript_50486/g.161582  ORF Transcript_50486/g.161582 Transcript_50486/m.161582 type:complete len:532 (-) Transcript_50486:172-1767(-)
MKDGCACSRCKVEYSPVWRKDKETKERICNQCYRKLYYVKAPAPPTSPPAASKSLEEEFAAALSLDSGPQQEASVADLTTPAVETDSEYPDVELDDCPRAIHVKASGSQRVDGPYARLSHASRGRPCYMKQAEKKPMYLFWNRKWIISWEFGSDKPHAFVKDAGGTSPCEPYPQAWEVLDKQARKSMDKKVDAIDAAAQTYNRTIAMRAIDADVLDASLQGEAFQQPDEEAAPAAHRKKKSRTPASAPSSAKAEDAKKSGQGGAAGPGASAAAAGAAAAPGAPAAKESGSEAEGPGFESSDEESDSNSSESSSSESASEKVQAKAKAAPPRPAAAQVTERMAAEFEAKLRAELSRYADPKARMKKFQQVRDMLMKKVSGQEQVAGLEPEKLQSILDRLDADFGAEQAAAQPPAPAVPRPPAGPPPKWLLEKEQAASGRQPEPAPVRSSLRKPGAPRQRIRRISYPENPVFITEVACYRGHGEQLWFTMPGAVVYCDSCEKGVPQSMGSLQGAPNQSQFAQNKFICSDCMGF